MDVPSENVTIHPPSSFCEGSTDVITFPSSYASFRASIAFCIWLTSSSKASSLSSTSVRFVQELAIIAATNSHISHNLLIMFMVVWFMVKLLFIASKQSAFCMSSPDCPGSHHRTHII